MVSNVLEELTKPANPDGIVCSVSLFPFGYHMGNDPRLLVNRLGDESILLYNDKARRTQVSES
jgi:hypothetical protein